MVAITLKELQLMRRKFNLHPQRRNLCEFDMASKLIMFGIDCQSPIKKCNNIFQRQAKVLQYDVTVPDQRKCYCY